MKIIFFSAGTDILASSRTRVYQYLPYLKEKGIESKVINFASSGECSSRVMKVKDNSLKMLLYKIYRLLQTMRFIFSASGYDLVLVQKVLLPISMQNILRFLNRHIAFDFDDAIFIKDIYTDNRFINRFIHMVSISKLVILENDFTKDFVQKYNKNILLITGPIEVNRYPLRRNPDNDNLTIGWIGSQDTLDYLLPLSKVLRRLSEKYGDLVIGVIGVKDLDMEGVRLKISDWGLNTEVANLAHFDIGIMPLSDDNWSRGKGGYKLLQYMSMGIPCLASPVGINRKIIHEGINGFLAKDEKEWEAKLSLLIEDRNLRQEMGLRGREIAVKEYSFESYIESFIQALRNINS